MTGGQTFFLVTVMVLTVAVYSFNGHCIFNT